MAEPDLSKIVNLIMENPEIIEQIKKLGEEKGEIKEEPETSEAENPKEDTEAVKVSYGISENPNKMRRKDLFSALKPYVSEERGRAMDTMMSIADILDMMRR